MIDFRWIALAPLLPLLASAALSLRLLAAPLGDDDAERTSARIAFGAALGALLLLLLFDYAALMYGLPGHVHLATWFETGAYRIALSFSIDGLSLPLATLFTLICTLALRFSTQYMHRDPGFHRFMLLMSLFTAAMLLIVLAGNAALTFVGWELAGVSSYLLINYRYEREIANHHALRVFLTYRIGDAGFILAIALALLWFGSLEWPALNAPHEATLTAALVAWGFVLAALVKSAQLPFSPWVGRALEGPTPSSAVFYGALVVHAGVFLLLRLEPLLRQSPTLMVGLVVLGILTALYGHLAGMVQSDVKTSLVFATITQVGLMVAACGFGWFTIAAWHLGLHAGWRALQFLMAPAYLALSDTRATPPRWLARRGWLYAAALQRFWVEGFGDLLLAKPTRAMARDVRHFDDDVLSRLVGLPEAAQPIELLRADTAERGRGAARTHGAGLAGRLLSWSADRLHTVEQHLVLRVGGGWLREALQHVGAQLTRIEALLEQPRYLLLMVMATFVVIL